MISEKRASCDIVSVCRQAEENQNRHISCTAQNRWLIPIPIPNVQPEYNNTRISSNKFLYP